MKKIISILAISFCSNSVAASSTINSVLITNNIVTIITAEARTENLAICTDAENANKWAFSLVSTEGKNLYRAVIAAHGAGKTVDITPTGDCQAFQSIERPQAIEIKLL